MAAHWRSQVDYDYPLGVLNAAELECYYGVTWELARDLQRAADIEGVVIGVRPMNPWATGQLRFGLTRPKPQSVKDKSSSNEDVALGRRPSLIGLVLAGEPMLPPVLPTDPAARNRLFTRYERRMSEWRAACARPDLTIDENQVVRLVGESEPVGPDTDLYELLLPPDMIPIDDPSTYERILTRLRLVHGLPVEHGALRQWDPKDAKGSELKLRLMEDHEPGGVPIVRFIPGEERAWAVSGVMADEGIAVGDMPPEVMAMPIGALAPGVRRP